MFLMCVLSVLLFIIYAIYFRADGGNYANVIKILKGLNSNTFNYLETNKHILGISKEVAVMNNQDTLNFFSNCVRLNKPCIYRGLASNWPAQQKWHDEKNEMKYLSEKLADHKLDVFALETGVLGTQFYKNRKWSFAEVHKKEKTYKEFLEDFANNEHYELAFRT